MLHVGVTKKIGCKLQKKHVPGVKKVVQCVSMVEIFAMTRKELPGGISLKR